MGVRIATGIVLIGLVILWLFFADYPVFTMGALFIYMVGAYEMGPLLKFKGRLPFVAICALVSTVLFMLAPPGEFVTGNIPAWLKLLIAPALIFWVVAIFLVRTYPHRVSWHNNLVINTIVGLCLLVPFLEGILLLRATNIALNPNEGAYLVLAVMALVWAADSGAYFTGRVCGKTPLLPAVSPKKTKEGLAGGMVLALIVLAVAWYLQLYSVFGQNNIALAVAGIGAIYFSVYGDLMESMLKRLVGIKDSGKIFPGHGGMLDRIDSQLAAIPVFVTLYWLVSGELFHAF